MFLDRGTSLEIDNMLASQNSAVVGGSSFGVFNNEEDIQTLEQAFKSLLEDGFTEDTAADRIAKLVFKETGIEPDYGLEEE